MSASRLYQKQPYPMADWDLENYMLPRTFIVVDSPIESVQRYNLYLWTVILLSTIELVKCAVSYFRNKQF